MEYLTKIVIVGSALFFLNSVDAKSNMKKFENPATQFVGVWEVEAHDFREFVAVPADLDAQLKENAGAFPIGQKIKIEWNGAVVMPGTFNTDTQKFEGPVGEALSITFLTPLEKRLCTGYWDLVCSGGESGHVKSFMIVEIRKWDAQDIKSAKLWPNVKRVNYSWVSLSRQHHLNVWVTRKGDLIFPIYLEGAGKEGKSFGFMGAILKRIDR